MAPLLLIEIVWPLVLMLIAVLLLTGLVIWVAYRWAQRSQRR
jgi:hypothetical protein